MDYRFVLLSTVLGAFPVLADEEPQPPTENIDLIKHRLELEKQSEDNPFTLSTHKMNYLLPVTYMSNVNTAVYDDIDDKGLTDSFLNTEAKFQLSLKMPLVKDLFTEDRIYFGMTLKSHWQVYAADASRPFRTTDYNPEIFYVMPVTTFEDKSGLIAFGLEHESNGEVQYLSRSWNRVYVQYVKDTGHNYAVSFKLWHRLQEDAKEYEYAPVGDDNPDIIDYYGHGELNAILRREEANYNLVGRYNVSTGKGYLELGVTVPLLDNVKLYTQYINGYGESLIDYNVKQERIGIGFVFSDLL
ncbi:phospholipase A [Vibrio sp. SCSIO 43136]|uniref:phospholipase A n=1 Tax=Vibrio sp. SCSIO 43136 TaxID=2819101 RepID=UPI0020754AB9|nr:phospholipase A [Vibrio sp. SCSIO 43136]USD64275.1 phospholipase A [Vibrio sp. SCSIO 43136]